MSEKVLLHYKQVSTLPFDFAQGQLSQPVGPLSEVEGAVSIKQN